MWVKAITTISYTVAFLWILATYSWRLLNFLHFTILLQEGKRCDLRNPVKVTKEDGPLQCVVKLPEVVKQTRITLNNLHWIISWRSINSQIIHWNWTWPLLNKFYCMISQFPISGFIHSSCYLLTKCRGRRRPCPLRFWLHWPFSDCCQAMVSDSLFYLHGGRDFPGIILLDLPNPTNSIAF